MFFAKKANIKFAAASVGLLGIMPFNTQAGTYDPATSMLELPAVELLSGKGSASYNAKLKLVKATEPFEFELTGASSVATISGERDIYDSATGSVHIPAVAVGSTEFYAKLKLIPGSNPLRFKVDQLVNNEFEACPSFATAGPTAGTCVLTGEITEDITLTKNTQWILSGAVFIGGDKTNNATLTINPGTQIFGRQGADYLWIRRGSKIMSEGTPYEPVVMSGANQQAPGEWGGLVLAGNALVNGCNESVAVCEVAFEAVTSEFYGGNDSADNSGIVKYTQILFAGFAVRPDEELNGLTLTGVGSGTILDYIQVHAGLDDGVEMFGGSPQMKHMVLTNNEDDSLDWGGGWTGKAQYVLVKQAANAGDRGIEADNNPDNPDSEPRSNPALSNMTLLGSDLDGSIGALLRRGTGVSISNSVFSGFKSSCIKLDGEATYLNAGTPDALSGGLTMVNTYLDCATNLADGDGATFTASDWFNAQIGNKEADPVLNGYLPGAGSPLTTGGMAVSSDAFFDTVDYIGAFKDANDDWTKEWTFAF